MKARLLICVLSIFLFTQTDNIQAQNLSKYEVYLGLGRQKTDIPLRQVFAFPVHSSYHIGIHRNWFVRTKRTHFQSLDLITFTNTSTGSGYQVQSNYGIQFSLFPSVAFSTEMGAGMVQLFRPKRVFSLVNQQYQEIRDTGVIRPVGNLKLSLSYSLSNFSIFGAYQITGIYKYQTWEGVVPFTYLLMGLQYQPERRKK